MSIIKRNVGSIILFIYVIVGTLLYKPEEISVALLGLFFLTLGWFCWQMIKHKISISFDVRNYPTDSKIIGVLFVFEMILFIEKIWGTDIENSIYNWCILLFLFCFFYVYVYKKRESMTGLFDSVIYAGIVVMGTMVFAYVGNENLIEWIFNGLSDRAVVASWALLFSIAGVISYCFCEDKYKSWFYLGETTLAFLVLCINHYCISLWLLLFVFLLIPIIFRPIAELVKRDVQMLFLFMFMLSNISLIINYMGILQEEVSLSFESGVYLEMLLAVGCSVFLYYWDRLPEGTDLTKISMLKIQKIFRYILGLVGSAFLIIVFWGDSLIDLPDNIIGRMIKISALPIVQEMEQSRSAISVIEEYHGLVGLFLLLLFIFVLGKNIKNNYDKDKHITTSFIIITCIFMIQLLFFTPPINIIPIYFICFWAAELMKEEKREVLIIKQQHYSENSSEV